MRWVCRRTVTLPLRRPRAPACSGQNKSEELPDSSTKDAKESADVVLGSPNGASIDLGGSMGRMTMDSPTCLVADDEPNLRHQLIKLLGAAWRELKVVGEAGDGHEAVAILDRERPDFAFLDINMPGLTGIELATAAADRTHIVFVTAPEEYALKAFEAGAVDYVLKPIDPVRLLIVIDRLKQRAGEAGAGLTKLLEALNGRRSPKKSIEWIQASIGNEIRFITMDEILYFQSDLKYTRIVTTSGEALIRTPIKDLIEELDPDRFWQTHRSTIVNTRHMRGVVKDGDGGLEVALRNRDERLKVSRAFEGRFRMPA
jgi:DNA-binding LytR/AlgR family response regulator